LAVNPADANRTFGQQGVRLILAAQQHLLGNRQAHTAGFLHAGRDPEGVVQAGTLVVFDGGFADHEHAADLLAQAEHLGAEPVLVSTSRELLVAVQAELNGQLEALPEPNRGWARDSVDARMKIVLADTLDEALDLSNVYAPEHLCLLTRDPWSLLGRVQRAGGVFVGESSMEALGDYLAGPSHVMPTGGTARFMSPVNVRDFQNIISVVGINEETLRRVGPAAALLARTEGLEAHARAIESRLNTQG